VGEGASASWRSGVGGYLKRWGLTVQRPVKRADERNDAAVALRLAEVYPKIAARAKRASSRLLGR